MKKDNPPKTKSQIPVRDRLRERYVMLTNDMTESAAYTSLSEKAVWLYIETLKSFSYKAGGNSHLKLPYKKVAWKMAQATYTKGMRELVRYGFLRVVRPGGLPKIATIYAKSESWKRISKEVVCKSGREAIRLGMAENPRTKNVGTNFSRRKKKR